MPASPPAPRRASRRATTRATRRATTRAAPLLLVCALSPGCRSWRPEPLPTAGVPMREIRGQLRLTRADGQRVVLTRARVAADTLRGERPDADGGGRPSAVAIPVDSVRGLERRRFSLARTVGLYFGVMGLVFFASHAVGSDGTSARPER